MKFEILILSILMLLIMVSCDNDRHILLIKNFDSIGLKKYLENEKGVNIETNCGLLKNINILTSNKKIININIFIECNFYIGEFNFNKNKKFKNLDNIIFVNSFFKSYSLNKIVYTLDNLKNELERKRRRNETLDLYILRSDWCHIDGLDEFLETFSDGYMLTFSYQNELYRNSLKPSKRVLKILHTTHQANTTHQSKPRQKGSKVGTLR